jgi:hypothetical protein
MQNKIQLIIAGALGAIILFMLYQRSRLLKAAANLEAYIKTSSDWNNNIQAKAKRNGVSYEQQLKADAIYSIKNDPNYKTWAFLL